MGNVGRKNEGEKMKRIFGLVIVLVTLAMGTSVLATTNFTPGDIVVLRFGDGTQRVTRIGQTVFLDEYSTNALLANAGGIIPVALVNTIQMPTTWVGNQAPLIAGDPGTGEGLMTLSQDGRFLVLTGFGATLTSGATPSTGGELGIATVTGLYNQVARVVGLVDGFGHIYTSTAQTNANEEGDDIRAAASPDGTNIWLVGSANGVKYTTRGSMLSTQVCSDITLSPLRAANIYSNTLYIDTATEVARATNTSGAYNLTNGVALPTSYVWPNFVALPGVGLSVSKYGFVMFNLQGGASNDTLYVADSVTNFPGEPRGAGGGVLKYCYIGGTWVYEGEIGAEDAYGVAGYKSGQNVILYITEGINNSLYTYTDTTGFGGFVYDSADSQPAFVPSGGNASLVNVRGIAVVPQNGDSGTISGPGALSVGPPFGAYFSSVLVGCPFTPSNTTYSVANLGTSTVSWAASVDTNAAWLTLSATSGSLASGASTNVIVSLVWSVATNLPAGSNYTATITFTNTTSSVGSTTRPAILAISALVVTSQPQSLTDGLACLVSQQNDDGSWQGSAGYTPVGYTGFAVTKLEERAFELGFASPFDDAYPYKQNVINGLNYLFSQAGTYDTTYGTNTGICYAQGGDESETYGTGIAMMAIAASRATNSIVNVPGSIANGMTFKAVLQSNVAYFAWSQNTYGGWGYEEGDRSDNSNSGYAVLGLRYAEAPSYGFACTIPAALKTNLSAWVDYIQNDAVGSTDDGGSGYTYPSGANLLRTGNLLCEMSFVGDNASVPRVTNAVAYIERHWNDNNEDPGWRPHNYQAMYCLADGLESLCITNITVSGSNVDWFAEFAAAILTNQQSDCWPADSEGDAMLSTEWALLVLEECTPPTITCPANIVVPNAPGQCSSNVTFAVTAPGCPAPAVVCMIGSNVITSPYAFPVGTTTVNCTASNGCGIATCSFTVTVIDTQPPSANCPANIVVTNAPGQCGAVVNFTLPSNTDNCGVSNAVATPPSGSFFPVGTTTVTVMVTDIHGNTNSCSFTVTVNDTQPPVIQCPTNLIVTVPAEMSCACDVELGSPQVSDNCGVASVVGNAPNCFPVGTNFIVWTATDTNRNTATCTQQVVVVQVPVDSSNFRILGIGIIQNDVTLSWQTFGYTTNVVQLATPTIDGSYTNSFTDIGVVFVPGSGLVSTNWVDYGGATNFPSRFYRIRLGLGAPPCP
jgi:hypothetical protein